MGGIEGIKWAVRAWLNRKTDARKEDAAADALEIDNEKNQVTWLEDRITQRDLKIDALYVELRQEQSAKLDEIHNRCDRPDSECGRRIPPRRKLDLKDKEGKNEKD